LKAPAGDTPYAVTDGGVDRLDAAPLLAQARRRFLPHVVQAEANYPVIKKNFEFSYRRHNLRLTFTLGFVVALMFNLPFEVLYRRATSLTPEQAVNLAERSTALYQKVSQAASTPASSATNSSQTVPDLKDLDGSIQQFSQALKVLALTNRVGSNVNYLIDRSRVESMWREGGAAALMRFLFGCLLTATLISFGAPFWNNLLGRLVPVLRSQSNPPVETKGE
jgi:hypothetical protein